MRISYLSYIVLAIGLITISPHAVRADAAGDALLKKCLSAEASLNTLSGTAIASRIQGGKNGGNIKSVYHLKKPGTAQIVFYAPMKASPMLVIHSDGKVMTVSDMMANHHIRLPWDSAGAIINTLLIPVDGGVDTVGFFSPKVAAMLWQGNTTKKIVGTRKIAGVLCQLLQITTPKGGVYTLYVGQDGRLRGGDLRDHGAVLESHFVSVQYNPSLPAKAFDWTPPATSKEVGLKEFTEAFGSSRQR